LKGEKNGGAGVGSQKSGSRFFIFPITIFKKQPGANLRLFSESFSKKSQSM
jgi:hypothetical protein